MNGQAASMTGDELRRIRRRLGLTQRLLAERVGLTTNTIARQERGEVRIGEPEARLLRVLDDEKQRRRKHDATMAPRPGSKGD